MAHTEVASARSASEAQRPRRFWAVFTIAEGLREGNSIWRRVGSAFLNRDGSYNLFLEALPVNGRLHMREVDDMPLNRERS